MTAMGWLQIALTFALVLICVKPLGLFMARLFSDERTFLSPVFAPVERGFYRLSGIDPAREQGWFAYTLAMLVFNAAGFAFLYGLMRLQAVLPLNPQGFDGVAPDLSFNTAVSFVSNTNWQSYGGETTMGHLVQMVGLTVQNFLSAATGIALAIALVRAFARSGATTVGNFWVDMTRSTLYVLLPLSILLALVFMVLNMPQTLQGSIDATTLEGAKQTIALGPVATQEAIKQLGTNGGGFFNANAAHPFDAKLIDFSATTRLSGVDQCGRKLRKGAVDAVLKFISDQNGGQTSEPPAFRAAVDRIARSGGTPLALADGGRLLGVIHLKDVVKADIKERFVELRRMGIRTVMVTGDNPVTAAAIASEAGVDDFIAEATPEDKLCYIRKEQAHGRLIAMCGDGTNDAPALAQADVGVAMQTGTQPAREAGNMVDLDSDPTKLIEVVGIGKQLLMTRGSLTTFSIANDVAKYFAIIPALFLATYPELQALNIMQLGTPQSAILSAVIFNALIIIALIPLALKGIAYRPVGAAALLRRNLLIYGLGGILVPFVGIKLVDLAVTALKLV